MSDIIRIPNIENYTQEIINGELILTPKYSYITEDELNRTILTRSTVLYCLIKNGEDIISSDKLRLRTILNDIFEYMPTQKILQTTTFNMKLTNENGAKGYNWCSKLNLSIQGKDNNGTMKEILNMIKVNNYSIQMTIELDTKKIIKLNIE